MEPRVILYIDFWGVHDPLTAATVLPGVRLLVGEMGVDRLMLATVERGDGKVFEADALPPAVEHVPLVASRLGFRPVDRALDQLRMAARLVQLVRRRGVHAILARTSAAGALAMRVSRATGVPFAVESFEPHAEYMVDCGEWRRSGPMFLAFDRLERAQRERATLLITVSRGYRDELEAMGIPPERLAVAPCPVDPRSFAFDPAARRAMRERHGLGDAPVVIYVGKFGGLYHDDLAYRAFAEALIVLGDAARLVILTPNDAPVVRAGMATAGVASERVTIARVPHAEVPAYLSAADLAMAPYRSTRSSAYLSPVKVGEYWASGLPVALTQGVGDEDGLIEHDPSLGALFDPEGAGVRPVMDHIRAIMSRPGHRMRIARTAAPFRSIAHTREAYVRLFDRVGR